MKFKAQIGVATGKFSTWSLKITNYITPYGKHLQRLTPVARHPWYSTYQARKNVAHVSKLFILEALKQGYLLHITKNYFDDSTTPPPPQSTHKLLSSCYNGANPLTYYLQNKVHTIAFILLDCL